MDKVEITRDLISISDDLKPSARYMKLMDAIKTASNELKTTLTPEQCAYLDYINELNTAIESESRMRDFLCGIQYMQSINEIITAPLDNLAAIHTDTVSATYPAPPLKKPDKRNLD